MQASHLLDPHPKPAAVMVVGGGIGGMRAALDLADSGLKVYLVEHTPCLGRRVAQLGYMFPQHDCVLCRGTPDHGYGCTRPSISPAYIQQNQHPNIEILELHCLRRERRPTRDEAADLPYLQRRRDCFPGPGLYAVCPDLPHLPRRGHHQSQSA